MKKLIVGLAVGLSLFAGSASAYMKCGSIGVVTASNGAKNLTALGKTWFATEVITLENGLKAVIYDNRKDGSILRVVPTEDGKTVAIIYYRDAESNLNGNPVLSGMCR